MYSENSRKISSSKTYTKRAAQPTKTIRKKTKSSQTSTSGKRKTVSGSTASAKKRTAAKVNTAKKSAEPKKSAPAKASSAKKKRPKKPSLIQRGLNELFGQELKPVDPYFLGALLILMGIGLVTVFSASMYTSVNSGSNGYSYLIKQGLFAVFGFLLMMLASRIDYRKYNSFKGLCIAMGIVIFLLAIVLIPGIGIKVNDARRWLGYGSLTFQPSELAKIIGIMYISSLIATYPVRIKKVFAVLVWVVIPMGLILGLTALEPSLSAALAIAVGMCAVLWFGMIGMPYVVTAFAIMGAGVLLLILKTPWRLERLLVLFGKSSVNYQIRQSLVAFGSGGLFGVGIGNGKQKLLFLPELQNDFIFANIGEETGLIGCLIVIGLYVFLILRGYKLAFSCKNLFGKLYAAGVMTLLAFQVFVNIGVAINAIPVTGMALPFISAGGTSLIVLCLMMSPILNISRQADLTKSNLFTDLFQEVSNKLNQFTKRKTKKKQNI